MDTSLENSSERRMPPELASFLEQLEGNNSGPVQFDYGCHANFEWYDWSDRATDIESSLKAAKEGNALTESEFDHLVQQRREKDALQDAWLDHFLSAIGHRPRGGYSYYGGSVHDTAKQYRLFENLQKFLNDRQVGQVDSDIGLRLQQRELLFVQRGRARASNRPCPDFLSSARTFLRDRLTSHHPDPATAVVPPLDGAMQIRQLESLNEALSKDRKDATFALGGVVPNVNRKDIQTHDPASVSSDEDHGQVQSFRIWWKVAQSHGSLEYPPSSPDRYMEEVEALAEACQPATFGMGIEDVLDETYRKAGKLDPTNFITDFCPYELGIIDQVQGMLAMDENVPVTCKLYKLNVYSAPGGKFRKHLDTPRGQDHFGSLVVCLPCTFSGGELVIRHEGRTQTFDWANDACNIQWAAFFGDCEHEVKEVTQGHRVTLTYNLFRGPHVRSSASQIDPTSLAIFQRLNDLLRKPAFLSQGAILGVPCSHYYAHNCHSENNRFSEENLKGADRSLFSALDRLGLQKCELVVLENEQHTYGGISIEDYCKTGGIEVPPRDEIKMYRYCRRDRSPQPIFGADDIGSSLRLEYIEEHECMSKGGGSSERAPAHVCSLDIAPYGNISLEERIEKLRTRLVKWIDNEPYVGGDVVVAHQPCEMQTLEGEWEDGYDEVIDNVYSHSRLGQVVWLRKPQRDHTEAPQTTYMAYGNEAEVKWRYSRSAILFIVPPWSKRSTQA